MAYWSKTPDEVIRELSSSKSGLSEVEVHERLKVYGINDIPKRKEKPALSLLVSQMKDLLVIALIVASVISYLTGGLSETIIILAIVTINILVGFAQEYKSEKALQKLSKFIRYRAKVLRNGVIEVDTREIVPGDIVLLETGDRIPADIRLIDTDELEIDESIVTGESYPVQKSSKPIRADRLEPQKMENMAFLGTLVVNGKGRGIVVSTGMKSTFGKVVGFLKSEEPETNYHRNIKSFSSFLVRAIVIGVVFIFVINALTGKAFIDSALFSLALAVGIIPESLPIILTIGLSRGAIRMSRGGVIVKKLSAIEDLGNMDVFCADKTGTITQNRITLIDYLDLDGNRSEELLRLAHPCVSVVETGGRITGNPIDVAIVEYCIKHPPSGLKCDLVELIPFDYSRRRTSVVVREGDKFLLICKGAPEGMIAICTRMKIGTEIMPFEGSRVQSAFENLSRKGYRVIGLGVKEVEEKADYAEADESDLTFIGLLCFMDPLKATAKESISEFKDLGVEVKILTGDNPIVTKTIAEQVGIEARILHGSEIDAMDEETLRKAVEKSNVFARLTPEHKTRIVSALSKNGHVTGFMGDGVNDAPALRYADVGISVDGGVDIAKEAADIILTEESLEIISKGITEGRTTFGNTTKYILNTVSANMGNMTTLAIISLWLNFLPMLPFQVLMTNLISDGPLLAISTDRVDEEELQKPRNWNMRLIGRFTAFFGGISSIFDFVTMGVLLYLAGSNIDLFRTGWFIESTMSEILVTFPIRTKKRFYASKPGKILILTSIVFGLLTVLLPYSQFNKLFEFHPPDPNILILIACILVLYFAVAESVKQFFYKRIL